MATQTSLDTVQEFYIVYMTTVADPAGLIFWADYLDSTDDLTDPIRDFGNASAHADIYKELDNEALINSLYQQLFNRDADAEGLAFYLERLDNGEATRASIPKQIIDGAVDTDATILVNKVSAAHCLTDYMLQGREYYYDTDTPFLDNSLDAIGLQPVQCDDIDYPDYKIYTEDEVIVSGVLYVTEDGVL